MSPRGNRIEPRQFIKENLPLTPVPGLPEILLHLAHSGSGLWRLIEGERAAPYWAYAWAGGMALALYLSEHRDVVRSRRVLDLGTGSGLVAIAAAKAGAAQVLAAEIDPKGLIALALNAEANGVTVTPLAMDLIALEPPQVEIVLVGDLFYDAETAARLVPFLDTCLAAGMEVLVGDPGRAFLPRERLETLAEYRVLDVGETRGAGSTVAWVFRFMPAAARLPVPDLSEGQLGS